MIGIHSFNCPCLAYWCSVFYGRIVWKRLTLPLISCCLCTSLAADLFEDLETVYEIDRLESTRLPVGHNHVLQGGYINMPSARCVNEGQFAAQYAHAPPYKIWSARLQPLDCLEITTHYRIFKGVADLVLSPHGFGDFSDRGINFKLSLFQPEDSGYSLPGIAIGADDVCGTRAFAAEYIVLTHVERHYNMEFSLGYGTKRLQGFFGGVAWTPFFHSCNAYMQGLSLIAEYDSIDYAQPSQEPHPGGRESDHPINMGLNYRLWNLFDFSISHIRGRATATALSAFYNIGHSEGLFYKRKDPLPYSEKLPCLDIDTLHPCSPLVKELARILDCHGFTLINASLCSDDEGDLAMRLHVNNRIWPRECQVREQLYAILKELSPHEMKEIIIIIESEGFPSHEYFFRCPALELYRNHCIACYELHVLTPVREFCPPDPYYCRLLYSQPRGLFHWQINPRLSAFFGSAVSKFQYSAGLSFGLWGYLPADILYRFSAGSSFLHSFHSLGSTDMINPSQLINVHSDLGRYLEDATPRIDEAYIQRSWNLGCGRFARLSLGHFELTFGGAATEFLYAPINCNWAIGVEYAELRKRKYSGLSIFDTVRRLHGNTAVYETFHGRQYFLNLYFTLPELNLELEANIGQFMAKDKGARLSITRRFSNGTALGLWYTPTNAHDIVNGERHHDKGISIEIPLDIFYEYSCRERCHYAMSAWLRDAGYRASSGTRLYPTLREERMR